MRPLRIVTTGLAATFPVGGVFWDYLQYPLGFRRLGHDVLYLEDPARWGYDPEAGTFVEDGARGAALLAAGLRHLDPVLARSWHYRDFRGTTYGRARDDVARFCREADLFVNISGSCLMREEYFAAARVAFVDTDPMYTQAWVRPYLRGELEGDAEWRAEQVLRHDLFFTFAGNVGAADCAVPGERLDWQPTRQPIVLDLWQEAAVPVAARRTLLTTVLSWEPREGTVWIDGVEYGGKSAELERFLELPARSALPIELALSGEAPLARLRAAGFRVRPALEVSRDPWTYRDHLAGSAGEWSVAKHAYVASRSGWFSCRSACYLAAGVPVVVQETGFSRVLPAGEGLFSFTSIEEAVEGIARVAREPERQARAARRVAEEWFDAAVVLGEMLRRAGL